MLAFIFYFYAVASVTELKKPQRNAFLVEKLKEQNMTMKI